MPCPVSPATRQRALTIPCGTSPQHWKVRCSLLGDTLSWSSRLLPVHFYFWRRSSPGSRASSGTASGRSLLVPIRREQSCVTKASWSCTDTSTPPHIPESQAPSCEVRKHGVPSASTLLTPCPCANARPTTLDRQGQLLLPKVHTDIGTDTGTDRQTQIHTHAKAADTKMSMRHGSCMSTQSWAGPCMAAMTP